MSQSTYTWNKELSEMFNKVKKILGFIFPSMLSFIVAFIIFRFVLCHIYVPSASMANTIPPQSNAIILRQYLCFRPIERGDIIVFMPGEDNHVPGSDAYTVHLLKRVAGLPGDIIEIIDGKTIINGEYYDESEWLAELPEEINMGPVTLGEDEYFVLGDNRNHSIDSRYWENPAVSGKNITGRLLWHN